MRIIRLSTVFFTAMVVALNLMASDGPNESQDRMRAPLVNAHIPITEPALIQALHNEDKRIATAAAAVLPSLPKSPRMIAGLYSVLDDPDDLLVVTATRSLLQLGERSWEQQNVQRLNKMQDQVAKFQMAGLLAQIGNTQGWPVVLSAVTSEQYAMVALENIHHFHGKLYQGAEIDVPRELQRVLPAAPANVHRQIQSKIDALKKTSH
jgi:HEAT repeat protein